MQTAHSNRIVSVGEAMVELAPERDGLYRQGYAGDTFNTIWHMGQLLRGQAACGFVTRVGTDGFSEKFVAGMAADGLDVSGVLTSTDRSMGLYLIELDGVERSFHYWRRDSAASQLAADPPALAAALRGAGLIHVSGITLAILTPEARTVLMQVLADARRAGATVSFDPNVRPRLWASPDVCRDAVRQMLALTDIALPSFDDEAGLWGDADPAATIRRLTEAGVREIVVKDGPRPVLACRGGETMTVETPPVSAIRDTTGAGDAFNAGYLAARHLGAGLHASVALGQALSAGVIGCLGARAGDREIEAVRQRLPAAGAG